MRIINVMPMTKQAYVPILNISFHKNNIPRKSVSSSDIFFTKLLTASDPIIE